MSLSQALLATALAKASHTYLLWVEPGAMEIEALQASYDVFKINKNMLVRVSHSHQHISLPNWTETYKGGCLTHPFYSF